MKKIFLLLIISFVVMPFCLYADDEFDESENNFFEDDVEFPHDPNGPLRIKNRAVEIGFLHTRFGFSNNFLTFGEIFSEKLVLDIDKLEDGLKINMDVGLTPFYFTYSKNNNWGFGLSFGVDAAGGVDISGNLLTFKEAVDDKSDVGGAAFAQIQFSGFFHIKKFKIKVKPSLYYPLFYVEPDFSYTYQNTTDGTIIDLKYKLRAYTPVSTEGSSHSLSSVLGVDFFLGAEYPLSEVLGLSDKSSILNFDVGVDLINIPMVPAQMKNYMEISGRLGGDTPINLSEDGFDSFSTDTNDSSGEEKKYTLRPFKMLFWADWQPFKIKIINISFIPILGFSISPLYSQPASFEGGIKARLDLSNLFIATFGIGYYDRIWKNSLDFALNFRAFEFDLGVDLRSSNFVKSWSGGGFGVNLGFKFGW